jgi:parvulin-like peptidyl-prolyl isomerase
MDQDRRNALLLYGLIGVVVAFAFAIIAYGYYQDRIAPNHETVLTVGDRKFSVAFLQRRVKADLNLGLVSEAATVQDVVIRALQNIELEEMTRRTAEAEGLVLTGADIDAYIKDELGLKEDAPRDVFAASYRQDVLRSGLLVNEYREMKEARLAQERLIDQYEAGVPVSAEQADTQLIRTNDEAAARTAKARIDAGEGFNVVAATVSIDASKSSGGELGWVTRDQVPDNIAQALFTLPIGQVSDLIQEDNGWYIVLARGREVRDIDDQQKGRIAAAMFGNKLDETRENVGSTSRLSEDQIARIGRNLLGG